MNFFQAALIVNLLAMIAIYFSTINDTPLCGTPPHRIGGIFVPKHLVITVVSGTIIGWFSRLSNIRPIWQTIVRGIVFQFIIGQLIHFLFGVKTMLLYRCGLSGIPDGTGRLATPVFC